MEWFGFWLMIGLIGFGAFLGSGIEDGLKDFGKQVRKGIREAAGYPFFDDEDGAP